MTTLFQPRDLAPDVVDADLQTFPDGSANGRRLLKTRPTSGIGVLVVMAVDVHDHHVVELALHRLLACMRQQPGGVEFVDRYAPPAFRKGNGISPRTRSPTPATG